MPTAVPILFNEEARIILEEKTINLVTKQVSGVKPRQVKASLELLDEGNTIPFIARYRKEMTGALDEVQLQEIATSYEKVSELEKRQQTVIKAIADEGKLTDRLKNAILAAEDLTTVEDLYLPYKKKRQTKAQKAKAQGLTPLANWILTFPAGELEAKAAEFVTDEVPDAQAALDGAHEILAEAISEMATVRAWLRGFTRDKGQLVTTLRRGGEEDDERSVYQQYYDFSSPIADLSSYQVLAINRGEKEKVLSVKIDVDQERVDDYLRFRLVGSHDDSPAVDFITEAYRDAYKRFMGPAISREIRKELTEKADEQAIKVFGDNLYHLLMQAPIKGKVVLGFDPAYRTGCKLAVIDPHGKLLHVAVIYPHKPAPEKQRAQAEGQLIDLINQYHVEMIAIGNGTASRESAAFVAQTLKKIDRPVYYVIVNEAGASVYSASEEARDEFPDLHVEKRSAISIGRRLQDPLAELVKINPQAIGVGQYQHDLPEKELSGELDAVVERAVNQVGVNLNTASYQLLTRIAGLNETIAHNIVNYRNDHGAYQSRTELKNVSRLGPKVYQQSVGFLRIIGGKNPLDNTDIHPESYPVAKKMMKEAGVDPTQLGTSAANQQLKKLDWHQFVGPDAGKETVADIYSSLQTPGRDLRDTMPAPLLRQDVLTIDDLKPGMKLEGTVRNVVDFGAFVDIGVKHDGLVHVSKMSKRFIRDPRKVVAVGDIVTVWVESVDLDRQRIQLTMVEPKEQAVKS